MSKGILFLTLFIAIATSAMAATWARRYTEANTNNIPRSIELTDDGGFIIAGTSSDNVNDASTYDVALMKLDESGNVQWKNTYGGNDKDIANSIVKTSDVGFLIVGATRSYGAGNDNFWLLKLDSSGNIQWQNTYGSDLSDVAYSAAQTSDGGFIVAGVTEVLAQKDYWVLRLSSSGAIQWQRIYGSIQYEDFTPAILTTSDGGFIMAGDSPRTDFQTVLLKLNANGDPEWEKFYQPGGVYWLDQPEVIQKTSDGGFAILTQTWNIQQGIGFLKVDSSGNLQFLKKFELGNATVIRDFDQTTDGGYIIVGMNSDALPSTGALLLKLDSNGTIQWQKSYDTTGYDEIISVKELSSGEIIFAGASKSSGSQFTDFWILKSDSSGSIDASCDFITDISMTAADPTPTTGDISFQMFGTFETSQSTAITPSSQSITVVEQCSGGCPLITVNPASLPDGVVNIAYNQTITATGGTAPYTFAVTSGALPDGLGLDPNTGVISGTPTTVQSVTFQITATDSTLCTGSRTYTVDINATCLFCDDFEDGVQPNWLITKPDFSETGGFYVGTPAGSKAETVASPVFSGCSLCTVQAVMRTGGGVFNKVWLLAFYIDKDNDIELLMKEETDRWVIKQRINKSVVAKAKGILTIDPNVDYAATITYDGTTVNVIIDGTPLITFSPVGAPNGTVGFRVKNTVGSFGSIIVN